jgi:glucosamine kinase
LTVAGDVVLGVDGGGTKTLVALADREGQVRHLQHGRTIDPFANADWPAALGGMVADLAPWRRSLADAVLGLPCYGEVADVSAAQREGVRSLLSEPHEVINDVEAAFDGALAGAAGVLLLAGTGSMAWAGDGRTALRCGGWGEAFGDEGSAFWIGREALGEASRALDGRSPHTAFAEQLLARLGLEPRTLLHWCLTLPTRRSGVAALAIEVDRLAEANEPTACALLRRAGDALADHAHACAARLGLPGPIAWSYAGSVFKSRTVMARVADRLGTPPRPPRLPPVGGALMRAARRAGWAIDETWIERLGRALLSDQDLVKKS